MSTQPRAGRVRTAAAVVIAGALAWAGCEPQPTEVTVIQPAPPGAVTTARPVTLSMGNVAAVIVSQNNATIQRSEIARVRAADPRVRAFAGRVLSESQMAASVINQQLASHGITPQPEAISMEIDRNSAQTLASLQSAQGLEVDRIYLQTQIANDRWLISSLDAIVPSVPSDQRGKLMELRDALNARVFEAQNLEATVLAEKRARKHKMDGTYHNNGTYPNHRNPMHN